MLKFPLGKFIISPSFYANGPEKVVEILGYDLSKIALDDKMINRMVKQPGGFYTNELKELLSDLYPLSEVETSS